MSSVVIHPTSIVSSKAELCDGVVIGPFCVVHGDVQIGKNTNLTSHVVLENGSRIGSDCKIYQGATIGNPPQDLKYANEPTLAIVGDRTTIRECVSINRGTISSGRVKVGSDCLIMAYCHVAHDCTIGNHVIIANAVQLGGHVEIGDFATLGGLAKIHQFCRVGTHAMVGADAMIVKDVIPFALTGHTAKIVGINKVGLKRKGFSEDVIQNLAYFFDFIFFNGYNVSQGIVEFEKDNTYIEETQLVADFIRSSRRGIHTTT